MKLRSGVVALLCVLGVTGACRSGSAQDDRLLPPGARAPAFRAMGVDGKPVSLAGLRGKVILVDFWATWCGPCRAEVPEMKALYSQYGSTGLCVVAISLDDADSFGDVPQFVKDHSIPYLVLSSSDGNHGISMHYHAPHPPVQYLIDRKGVIRWSRLGYSGNDDPAVLRNLVKKLLAARA